MEYMLTKYLTRQTYSEALKCCMAWLNVTHSFFFFYVAAGKDSEFLSWSAGWTAPEDSKIVSVDVVQHMQTKSVGNLPAAIQASGDSMCEPPSRHQQEWPNMEALHQTITLPALDSPTLNDQFPAQLSTNLPAAAYMAVGPLASRSHPESYEACNRPADYVTVAALPSRAISPPEVQPVTPLVPSMPPPQPHLPTDAILVRPRLGLIAGHSSSSMVAGSHVVYLPPPLTGDPVAPTPPYISTQLEPAIGNADVHGGGFFIQSGVPSPPVHIIEEENNMTGASTHCDRCGNRYYPQPAWQTISPVYQAPPHVAMPTCFRVVNTGIVAGPPPLTQSAPVAAPPLPTAYPPGMIAEVMLPAPVILPPSGHVSPMGIVGGTPVGVPHGVTAVQLRAVRPAPLCSNCGASGHIYAECTEPTIDAVLSTGMKHSWHDELSFFFLIIAEFL